MTPRPFPRPAFLSPRAQAVERQKWREFLSDLTREARRAAAGEVLDKNVLWGLQRHVFRGAATTPFPLHTADARGLTEATVKLAQVMLGGGHRNPRLCTATAECAAQLEGLLNDAAAADAQSWRRQFPDD